MILKTGQRWRWRLHDATLEYIIEIRRDEYLCDCLHTSKNYAGGVIMQVISNDFLRPGQFVGFGETKDPETGYFLPPELDSETTEVITNSWGSWSYLPGQDNPNYRGNI